jgi:pimeloyl-ACP methyl ester carboxylesterase
LFLANTTAVYTPQAREAWSTRVQAVQASGMSAVADMVVQRYLNESYRAANPDVVQRVRATLLCQDAHSYALACQAVAGVDWLDQLNRISCPTHVLAGALDAGATPAMAQELAQRIPGAQLTVLPKASHLSVAECPAECVQLLRAWLVGA